MQNFTMCGWRTVKVPEEGALKHMVRQKRLNHVAERRRGHPIQFQNTSGNHVVTQPTVIESKVRSAGIIRLTCEDTMSDELVANGFERRHSRDLTHLRFENAFST